jgi:hypothetical protein
VNDKVPKETTFIYVIHNEHRGNCKIGKANDPETRLKNLQTGNESTLRLTCMIEVEKSIASKVERGARKIAENDFGKSRTREWIHDIEPEKAQICIELSHDIERGRNFDRVARHRIMTALKNSSFDDYD